VDMQKRLATDIFSEWAMMGKDEGMQKGHFNSVNEMLSIVDLSLKRGFSAIDVGCGNGWVCRRLSNDERCRKVVGIDGSEEMIRKAKSFDSNIDFYHALLPEWKPNEKFDLIHSMEFLYYLKKPLEMLKEFYEYWINPGGIFIAGIDFYLENEDSHGWPERLNVHMTKLSINEWEKGLLDAGFKNIEIHQVASTNDFVGTLVLKGEKLK
tara:strand:+ start:319 stop:945 length:627 start_codon:yes stop_codon:yes gene_type:complete